MSHHSGDSELEACVCVCFLIVYRLNTPLPHRLLSDRYKHADYRTETIKVWLCDLMQPSLLCC